jgi:hypothetical protein
MPKKIEGNRMIRHFAVVLTMTAALAFPADAMAQQGNRGHSGVRGQSMSGHIGRNNNFNRAGRGYRNAGVRRHRGYAGYRYGGYGNCFLFPVPVAGCW